MDWHATIGIVSGIIQVSAVIPYVRGMLKGSTRPNAVSMGLWTLLGFIAVLAQCKAGASWSVILLIGVTFNAALITVLSLIGYGYAKYGLVDWICLALGITGISGWVLTNNPLVALVCAVLASVIASVPTIVKTYRDPHSENTFAWAIALIASSLAILSTTRFDLQNLLYPFADWLENILFVCLSFFGQRKKS